MEMLRHSGRARPRPKRSRAVRRLRSASRAGPRDAVGSAKRRRRAAKPRQLRTRRCRVRSWSEKSAPGCSRPRWRTASLAVRCGSASANGRCGATPSRTESRRVCQCRGGRWRPRPDGGRRRRSSARPGPGGSCEGPGPGRARCPAPGRTLQHLVEGLPPVRVAPVELALLDETRAVQHPSRNTGTGCVRCEPSTGGSVDRTPDVRRPTTGGIRHRRTRADAARPRSCGPNRSPRSRVGAQRSSLTATSTRAQLPAPTMPLTLPPILRKTPIMVRPHRARL